MAVFKRFTDLTDEEKREVSEMTGKIELWILEGRSLDYMSKQLKLSPCEVLENMCETIYMFLNRVGGPWRYLKWLYHKRH